MLLQVGNDLLFRVGLGLHVGTSLGPAFRMAPITRVGSTATKKNHPRKGGSSALVAVKSPLQHHALGLSFEVHVGLALDRYRYALDSTVGELARSLVQ